jgi:tight adherence protein C
VTPAVLGAALGLCAGAGLWLAAAAAPRRPIPLDRRLAPYLAHLADAVPPSRLLAFGPDARPTLPAAARRLVAPLLADAARVLERVLGGRSAVCRRLAAVGDARSVDDFRVEQVAWGAAGLATGAVTAGALTVATGRSPVVVLAVLPVGAAVTGVLGRDWALSRAVRRRQAAVLAELPDVAELVALAVTAGEGVLGAVDRVCRLTGGALAADLADVLGRVRAGAPVVTALESLRDRTAAPELARFLDGIVIALERGTPLAEVLRAQAADVRDAGRRALLESGGRREIAMLLPVVFGILPTTVIFALYPGLVSITALVG